MSKNVYEMVAERIIEELEKGRIPWERPWTGVRAGAYNRISKKPYSLLNQLILGQDGEWASFKQWSELGGHIRRGEKSSFVTFWKMQETEVEKEDGTKEIKQIPLLRYYNVFHISQVDGVEPLDIEKLNTDIKPIESAEKVLHDYWNREGIRLEQEASNKAYYSPMFDLIHLPLMEQFTNINEFYGTAFHESVHSTMKESRCNRQEERKGKNVAYGSDEYSREELCAELGSADIMNILGLETTHSFRNSTAYIQSWIKALRNDTRMIVSASSKAEKAVKFILNEA